MTLNERLLSVIQPGKILAVQVGFSRTAVLVKTQDGPCCGIAATLANPDFMHRCQPAVRQAGRLHRMGWQGLAGLIDSESFTEVSIGLAAVNALLPQEPEKWTEENAESILFEQGKNKNVAIVGHFPFVDRLRPHTKNLWVLEINPQQGDLPAKKAPEVLPQADIVAITATTLINQTLEGLLPLCRKDAMRILLGPSTPLSPVLFDFGIDIISGAVVDHPHAALMGIGQGISIHQLRKSGDIRFVTIKKD